MRQVFVILAATVATALVSASAANTAGGDKPSKPIVKVSGDGDSVVVNENGTIRIATAAGDQLLVTDNKIIAKDARGNDATVSLEINGESLARAIAQKVREDVEQNASCGRKSAEARQPTVMKAYKSALDFRRLRVSRAVRLIVEERTSGNIVVRAPESIMPYVKVFVKNNELVASLDDKANLRKVRGGNIAEVYIPNNGRIEEIEASGASKVEVKPCLNGDSLSVEASGASHIALRANVAKRVKIEASGASDIKADITGAECKAEAVGASTLTLSGKVGCSDIEVVGASTANADKLESGINTTEACGASSATVGGRRCNVEASGASKINVMCEESLTAGASGASTIVYGGDCETKIIYSGASTIKKR